jgi:hypothetical protein
MIILKGSRIETMTLPTPKNKNSDRIYWVILFLFEEVISFNKASGPCSSRKV